MKSNTICKDFAERLNLEILHRGKKRKMHIATFNINRPGLQLAGYYEHFSAERVQVIGEQETSYLKHKTHEERVLACENLCKFDFPCLVLTTVLEPIPELMDAAMGRGLLANPALAWEYATGAVFSPDELHEKVKALHARLPLSPSSGNADTLGL